MSELEGLRISPVQRLAARSVDVTDLSSLEQTIGALMEDGYPVDILVNAAGIVHCGHFADDPMTDFYRCIEVDLFGTVNAAKAVVPTMIERQKGHIVNLASLLGFASTYGYTAYCAAKFGVRGFSNALRHELGPHGVHVSCVYPQDTGTPGLQQEREMQSPEMCRINEGAQRALDVDVVARSILRGISRRKEDILPGLETRVFFWLAHGPRILSGLLTWFFIDRKVAQVYRERELSAEG
jgi:3-dehydrosphinganine reductase